MSRLLGWLGLKGIGGARQRLTAQPKSTEVGTSEYALEDRDPQALEIMDNRVVVSSWDIGSCHRQSRVLKEGVLALCGNPDGCQHGGCPPGGSGRGTSTCLPIKMCSSHPGTHEGGPTRCSKGSPSSICGPASRGPAGGVCNPSDLAGHRCVCGSICLAGAPLRGGGSCLRSALTSMRPVGAD